MTMLFICSIDFKTKDNIRNNMDSVLVFNDYPKNNINCLSEKAKLY